MPLEAFLSTVRKTVLANGLTLISREERGTGVVAINTWVKAGYFHEPDEVAGMAHLFEHMFFKGSKKFSGPEEISRHVSLLGGMTNAATIYDSTNYYFVLPSEGFEKGMEIQADAILNPLFEPEELKKEAEVVIEESNRKFDNPPAVATERMFAVAFRKHRMRRWRIGSNEVLRNIRRDDLLDFFQSLYRPSNMIVVVAGDVRHEEVIAAAEKSFGLLPRGDLRKEAGPAEPPQTEFRYGESFADIKQSYTVFGWHTAGEGHEDEEALDILAWVLGAGRYSRLYRKVIGPLAATSVSAYNTVHEDVGMFVIRAGAEESHLAETERRIVGELERMKTHGPVAFELELARNRIEAGFVFQLEQVLGQAETLAYFEARGGYEMMRAHLARLRAVTADQVRQVAQRYLTVENLTLFRHRREGSPEQSREQAHAAIEAARTEADLTPPVDLPIPQAAAPPSAAAAELARHRFVLSNGITLFVQERRGTPAVSASIYFPGGRIHESSRNAGITQLMVRSMRRGTTSRDAEQINREIEFLGTQLGLTVEEDYFGFHLNILRRHFRPGLEILADVILHPTFPEEGVGEERHLQLAAIRRAFDSGSARPFQLFFSGFYGCHPYALPESGFPGTIGALAREDLSVWYRSTVVADGALVVVVGDVEPGEIRMEMEAAFGSLGKSEALRPAVPAFDPPVAPLEIAELRDRKQSAIVIGFPTVPPSHTDWTVLRVLQDVASGLAGTFFAELRGRRSLAYTVFAGDSSRQQAGAFVGYIATETTKEQEARAALLAEMRRLGDDGVQQDDLERAKSYLKGVTKIRLQTNAAVATDLAHNYLFGLGIDFTETFLDRVHGVTLDEVRRVAKSYLTRDNYVVSIMRGKA